MRYLSPYILKDLSKKMVFLGGPRQCGKTTLAKSLLEKQGKGLYLNWDSDEDKKIILKKKWHSHDQFLVFDEFHKYPRWKNWIKGLYDTMTPRHSILVTGSARLDVYRRGGDSLLGRYHYWRLHPFSLSEIPKGISVASAFERLMKVGGFPEPFFDNHEEEARRWRRERFDRILRDDIRDLESIRHIETLRLFAELLKQRVGGMCVLSNLAEDLHVSPVTLKNWLEILEKMYLVFTVKPFTQKISRAIQKPPKVYFFDNADVPEDPGIRFENLVATHLLKRIHFLEDKTGYRYELRYIRDKEKREVDFVILKEGKVLELCEAKWAEDSPSRHLQYYAERLKPERALQIVGCLKKSYSVGKIEILPAAEALAIPL